MRMPPQVAATARASWCGKPGPPSIPATGSSSPTRERIATPFQAASPWAATSYPRSASSVPSSALNASSVSLVSCSATTSGCRSSSHGSSRGTRCLTELTFQVAIRTGPTVRGGRHLMDGGRPRRLASCAVVSLHRNRGAKRAREAREELGLDPVAPLHCLLDCVEHRAALPVIVAALADGVAGACTAGPLLWVNGAQAAVRQRFTLAHELGHAWCRHDGRRAVDSFATLSGRTTTPQEIEANAFAAEFLIPRAAIEELAPGGRAPTLDEVVLIAAHYGTSAIMTVYRFGQYGDACVARLAAAIERREHEAAFERLGCTPLADRLGTLDALPYLSEPVRGSRLGAVLRGEAAAEPALAAA